MSKYNAHKAQCRQGHTHDSAKEAHRCDELHTLARSGAISELCIQRKFVLIPAQKYADMKSERECSYIADFMYIKDGVLIIEDVKGYKTPEYVVKRKLLKQRYCSDGRVVFIET